MNTLLIYNLMFSSLEKSKLFIGKLNVDLKQEIDVFFLSKYFCLLDFSLRICKLKLCTTIII